MDNNELNHHGIPGMKWGVRRYQNRDGSLTAIGKKKRKKAIDYLDKIGAIKRDESTTESTKPKTVKDMTDDELRTKLNRITMETRYNELTTTKVPKSVISKYIDGVKDNAAKELSSYTVKKGMEYLSKMLDSKK